jgi:hypothetical protein
MQFVCAEAPIVEEQTLPEHPEMIVFAAYQGMPKNPPNANVLNELVGNNNSNTWTLLQRKVGISSL